MSGLLLSRIDTSLLYPAFLERVKLVLDDALKEGAGYWAISGFRSYSQQEDLFAQGRTKPGNVVTRARGGQSSHNFGIAVDLVRDGYMERAGIQPDYRPESYDLLGPLAGRHGLAWGGNWTFKDLPHIQWPGLVTNEQLEPLRAAFESGGLSAVWQFLDGGHA